MVKYMPNFMKVKRLSAGLTITGLAEQLGVSKQLVSQWEGGDGWPGPRLIPRLAKVFGQKPEAFARELEQSRMSTSAA